MKLSNIFLSETTRPRAFICDVYQYLVDNISGPLLLRDCICLLVNIVEQSTITACLFVIVTGEGWRVR